MSTEGRSGPFKTMVRRALHAGIVGEAVRTIAALRGRSLVLVYHRVAPTPPSTNGAVPLTPSDVFRRQVEALAEVGEIRPLDVLLEDRHRHAKLGFALTFDDDYATHVDHVLPILQAIDVPATFFLSGRAPLGLGEYWFERLDRLIESRGVHEVSRLLHVRDEGVEALSVACERDPALQQIIENEVPGSPSHLGRVSIEALAGAGMAVGFHTLRHQILTRLDDRELEAALTEGRTELEQIVGRPLVHFAYPHGKADMRTARKVRDVGYDAAWTGRPRPMQPRSDRYLLGRWEPGLLDVDRFLVGIAITLTRGAHR
jgi:peptidoglycan/xylan/chitin deacetylase (PgdA/CDA1 family)